MEHVLILSWTQPSVLLVTVIGTGGKDIILEDKHVELSEREPNVR